MAKALDRPSLYETDYVAWLEEQVAHLRAGRLSALDVQNVADELESLMKSERRQLRNRLEVLVHHLLKWDHQPHQRSNRWRATVQEQRTRIRVLLDDSPSLKQDVPIFMAERYATARRNAAAQTGLPLDTFPESCPFTVDEILNDEWLP